MAQKPEIQYVGQFYVYGSEAPAPKKQEARVLIPRKRKEKVHKVYIDLVALAGIASAVVLLTALIMGGIRLNTMWQEHHLMESYVSHLKLNNATLEHNYKISYKLEDVEKAAADLGLVPESEVETRFIRVTVPPKKEKWSVFDNIRWFFQGLIDTEVFE